jgi:hypothetical protein
MLPYCGTCLGDFFKLENAIKIAPTRRMLQELRGFTKEAKNGQRMTKAKKNFKKKIIN